MSGVSASDQQLFDLLKDRILMYGEFASEEKSLDALAALAERLAELSAENERLSERVEDQIAANHEMLERIEAIRDAEPDEWKKHIIDGLAHFSASYHENYTMWKHRARLAEIEVERLTARYEPPHTEEAGT